MKPNPTRRSPFWFVFLCQQFDFEDASVDPHSDQFDELLNSAGAVDAVLAPQEVLLDHRQFRFDHLVQAIPFQVVARDVGTAGHLF